MSHIVTIQTKVHDAAAARAACRRLGLAEPVHGTARLSSDEATGLIVRLPGWQYPAVIDVLTGVVRYGNYGGSRGEQAQPGPPGLQRIPAARRGRPLQRGRVTGRQAGPRRTGESRAPRRPGGPRGAVLRPLPAVAGRPLSRFCPADAAPHPPRHERAGVRAAERRPRPAAARGAAAPAGVGGNPVPGRAGHAVQPRPAYVPDTRGPGQVFQCDMTAAQHAELLDGVRGVRGKVMLSPAGRPGHASAPAGRYRRSYSLQ